MAKKEQKNKAILLAAENEFLNKGIHGAAMETIAANAGVSKTTLYKYYPTKEDILNAFIDYLLQITAESLVCRYAEDEDLEVLLKEIINDKIKLLNSEEFIRLIKVLAIEQVKKLEVDHKSKKLINEGHKSFEKWILKCQKANKVSSNYKAAEITEWFFSLFDGLILWPMIFGLKKQLSKKEIQYYSNLICETFLKSFE